VERRRAHERTVRDGEGEGVGLVGMQHAPPPACKLRCLGVEVCLLIEG
jgi:hypothetical protein